MTTGFSLLETLLPTAPQSGAAPAAPEHSSSSDKGQESFSSVMSHWHKGKSTAKAEGAVTTTDAKPETAPSAETLKAALAELHGKALDLSSALTAGASAPPKTPPKTPPAKSSPAAAPADSAPATVKTISDDTSPASAATAPALTAVNSNDPDPDVLLLLAAMAAAPSPAPVPAETRKAAASVGADLARSVVDTKSSAPGTRVSPVASHVGNADASGRTTPTGKTRAPGQTVESKSDTVASTAKTTDLPATTAAPPTPKPAESHSIPTPVLTNTPIPNPAETAVSKPQPVVAKASAIPQIASISPGQDDGTGGALNGERMKSDQEKNEVAGGAVQKLPVTTAKAAAAAIVASGAATASGSAGLKADSITSSSSLVMDWPAKAATGNATMSAVATPASTADTSAAQADRVGHLLSQQVLMVRQSGANNLAVSLKLDPQTELNLQLTNHDGQIEASVRWERGNISGLSDHWKDLQESLARQNVQLLPLENKPSARPSANGSSSNGATTFYQSPHHSARQNREGRQDLPAAPIVNTAPSTQKASTRTASRQGWESWA